MKIEYKNTVEDIVCLRKTLGKEMYKKQLKVIDIIEVILFLIIAAVCVTIKWYFGAFAVLAIGIIFLFIIYPKLYVKLCERGIKKNILKAEQYAFDKKSVDLGEEYIVIEQNGIRKKIAWSNINSCEINERGILITLNNISALLIPKSAFNESEDISQLASMITDHINNDEDKRYISSDYENIFRILTFNLDIDEYIEAVYTVNKKNKLVRKFKRWIMCMAALFLFGICLITVEKNDDLIVYCSMSIIIIFIIVPRVIDKLIMVLLREKIGKAGDVVDKEKNIVLSKEGIYYYSQEAEAYIEWNELSKYTVGISYIIIEAGDKAIIPVDRKAFTDQEEEDKFVSIIEEHIK